MHPNDDESVDAAAPAQAGGLLAVLILGLLAALAGGLMTGGRPPFGPGGN